MDYVPTIAQTSTTVAVVAIIAITTTLAVATLATIHAAVPAPTSVAAGTAAPMPCDQPFLLLRQRLPSQLSISDILIMLALLQ